MKAESRTLSQILTRPDGATKTFVRGKMVLRGKKSSFIARLQSETTVNVREVV